MKVGLSMIAKPQPHKILPKETNDETTVGKGKILGMKS